MEPRRDALEELLALVASVEDADDAIQRGLEFTAESLGAEFCAIVRQGTVVASGGFRSADVPIKALVDVAEGRESAFDYGGFRTGEPVAVPIDDETDARLVLARIERGFDDEDRQLLGSMGRVLT